MGRSCLRRPMVDIGVLATNQPASGRSMMKCDLQATIRIGRSRLTNGLDDGFIGGDLLSPRPTHIWLARAQCGHRQHRR